MYVIQGRHILWSWTTFAVVLAGCLFCSSANAQRKETSTEMVLERLSVGGVLRKNASHEFWELTQNDERSSRVFKYSHPTPTTYLRVVLDNIQLDEGQTISIRSVLSETPIDIIHGPIDGDDGKVYFSSIVPGYKTRIEMSGETLDGASATVRDIAFQQNRVNVKSIFEEDDREAFSEFADDPIVPKIGRAVAFISILGHGNIPRTCTGFLINRKELLTNQHCFFNLPLECKKSAIMFGYENEIPRGTQYRCFNVVPEHEMDGDAIVLDYALIELDHPVSDEIDPIALHTAATMTVPEPEQPSNPLQPSARINAVMIHHPAGEKKQVTRTNCRIFRERVLGASGADDFRHRCDTLKGSSGSPIVTVETDPGGRIEYCVAGLHHAGFSENGPFMRYNRAVNMPLIAAKLSSYGVQFKPCGSHTLLAIE